MRIDIHVHHHTALTGTTPDALLAKMDRAGIDGGVILSESPVPLWEQTLLPAKERMERIMAFTKGYDTLYPFFFIDPTEPDALDQVDRAADLGIRGFKTICTHFFPDDPRAVPVYHRIAETGRPYLFHSGILYDGSNASGNFNRPCNFEVLLSIPRLRFALAHISWPWCDECIAVYGKFQSYLELSGDPNAPEMFVDTTPGTPPLYRKDALAKLLDMPDAEKHILWGSDNKTIEYSPEYSMEIRSRDEPIYRALGRDDAFLDDLYWNNAQRFLNS